MLFQVTCPTCGWKFTASPESVAVAATYTHGAQSPSHKPCEIATVKPEPPQADSKPKPPPAKQGELAALWCSWGMRGAK